MQAVALHLPDNHVATLRSLLNNDFSDNEGEECLYLISDSEKSKINHEKGK